MMAEVSGISASSPMVLSSSTTLAFTDPIVQSKYSLMGSPASVVHLHIPNFHSWGSRRRGFVTIGIVHFDSFVNSTIAHPVSDVPLE